MDFGKFMRIDIVVFFMICEYNYKVINLYNIVVCLQNWLFEIEERNVISVL